MGVVLAEQALRMPLHADRKTIGGQLHALDDAVCCPGNDVDPGPGLADCLMVGGEIIILPDDLASGWLFLSIEKASRRSVPEYLVVHVYAITCL